MCVFSACGVRVKSDWKGPAKAIEDEQRVTMSLKNETIHENVLEDGLNANADCLLTTVDDKNDDDATAADRKNDKLDYLDVDSDGNLNIRCVGTDFQVI